MNRVHYYLNGLVETLVDREVQPYLTINTNVVFELARLESNVKSTLLLNLSRGYCSAVGGKAFNLYCVIAARFQIPVFSLGRGERVIISMKEPSRKQIDDIEEQFLAIWNVGKKPADGRDIPYTRRHFFPSRNAGPAHGWTMIEMARPPTLDIKGMCNALGIENIWDVVPKNHTLEATSAILRGERLEVRFP